MVTVPVATPVTRPPADTAATPRALDAQVTARPESTFPAASRSAAASCTAPPTITTAVAGLTPTDATGTFATPIAADALSPSLVAVIVVVPAATPVTRPAAETVAMAGLELAHVTARPTSTFPAASLGVVVSCTAPPTYTFAAAGLTTTRSEE